MTTFLKTTSLPTHGAVTLPQRDYVSTAVFREEQERLFANRWLCIGREEQVAKPGQYVLVEIGVESLIVVRDRKGTVRALYNVCRHRGTRLCEAARRRAVGDDPVPLPRLDLRRSTAASSGCPTSANSRASTRPTIRSSRRTWRAGKASSSSTSPRNRSHSPRPSRRCIGRVGKWNLAALKVGRRFEYDVKANWKLLFQNYSECYHCSPLHPVTGEALAAHQRRERPDRRPDPRRVHDHHGAGGSLTLSGESCGVAGGRPLRRRSPAGLLLLDLPQHAAEPAPRLRHGAHLPAGGTRIARCITCEFLFHPDTLANPAFNPDDGAGFWDGVNREDWHICEMAQAGVQSRAYRPGPYSRRESLSAAFDRYYRDAMGE